MKRIILAFVFVLLASSGYASLIDTSSVRVGATYKVTRRNGTVFSGKVVARSLAEMMMELNDGRHVVVQMGDVSGISELEDVIRLPVHRQFEGTNGARIGQVEIGIARGALTTNTRILSGVPHRNTVYSAHLRYHISRTFTVGIGLGSESQKGEGELRSWLGNNPVGRLSIDNRFLALVPEVTITYLDRHRKDNGIGVKVYGLLGIGWQQIVINERTEYYGNSGPELNYSNSVKGTAQVTPIGVRVGRSFAVFSEIGVGYKGLINFGADWRFRKAARSFTE